MSKKIAIIGAGLSGLACALELKKNGIKANIYEASDSVGGRVKTLKVDGFTLDYGFQVFLPSYEMGSYFLEYDKLNLKPFSAGSNIFKKNGFHVISDPMREPSRALKTAITPLATLKDKILTLKLIFEKKINYSDIQTETTAIDYLRQYGFSAKYINNFFIPFFSGVFLTKGLNVPKDYFKFLFKSFSKAYACLPEKGMSEIPNQMAIKIGQENINLSSSVVAGDLLKQGYDHIFVAHPPCNNTDLKFNSVKTMYFKTQSSKWASKTLYLNAEPSSIVNHVACLTAVNPSYAPKGWHLYSVNILENTDKNPTKDLNMLFGEDEIKQWEHIKTFDIKRALPANAKYGISKKGSDPKITYCGDYLESPSIQGALYSGRKVAREYLGLNVN